MAGNSLQRKASVSRLFTLARTSSRRRAARRSDVGATAQRLDELIADRRFRAFPDWLERSYQDDTSDDQRYWPEPWPATWYCRDDPAADGLR